MTTTIRQLRFVATISGVVNVNDGDEGAPEVTAQELHGQIDGSISIMINGGGLTGDTPGVIETHDYEVHVGQSISLGYQTISALRSQGYAVVVFSPEELRTATGTSLEKRLIELGNEAIEDLQD